MSRRSSFSMMAVALAATAPLSLSAQDAPCARSYTGRLGVNQIECNCSFRQDEQDTRVTNWFFRSEPRVGGIDPDGPAHGKLKDGDIITAINDVAITSRDGGRRFARLTPGVPVTLTVGRGDERVEIEVTPRDECGPWSSARQPASAAARESLGRAGVEDRTRRLENQVWNRALASQNQALYRALAGLDRMNAAQGEGQLRGWFGFGISCSDCTVGPDRVGKYWLFERPPQIYQVDPGSPAEQAGLRRNDVLTHIDNLALDSDEGAERFGNVEPGQVVTFRYRRGSQTGVVSMKAQEPPVAGSLSRALAELGARTHSSREQEQQALQRLRESEIELDKLQRQLGDRLHREQLDDAKRINEQMSHHLDSTREAFRLARERAARNDTEAMQSYMEVVRDQAATAATRQRLRYTGTIAGADVEVRGIGSVIVTEDEQTGEVVITTGQATIRLKPRKP